MKDSSQYSSITQLSPLKHGSFFLWCKRSACYNVPLSSFVNAHDVFTGFTDLVHVKISSTFQVLNNTSCKLKYQHILKNEFNSPTINKYQHLIITERLKNALTQLRFVIIQHENGNCWKRQQSYLKQLPCVQTLYLHCLVII